MRMRRGLGLVHACVQSLHLLIAEVMRCITGFREEAFGGLELYDGKLSRTVLREASGPVTALRGGNAPGLPGGRGIRGDT